jgi:hypothetical protein
LNHVIQSIGHHDGKESREEAENYRKKRGCFQNQRSIATIPRRMAANVLLAVTRTAAAGTPGVGVGLGVGKGGRSVPKLVVTVPGASVTAEVWVSVMTVVIVVTVASDDGALVLTPVEMSSVVVTSVEMSVGVSTKPVDSAGNWLSVSKVAGDVMASAGTPAVEVALLGLVTKSPKQ